jgi:hypothetical protein
MIKLYILLAIFISSNSFAKKNKNTFFDEVQVTSGVAMDIVEAQDIKARIFGYNIRVQINDKITSDFKLFFGATIALETGSNEVVGTVAEFEPNESISLNEGGVHYQPIQLLEFRVGALNQARFQSPLLIGSNAFAATEEKINFGSFYFMAQQAIPSNNKLSKRLGTVETGTPYFSTETIGLKFGRKSLFQLELSHYSFKDLSSDVASKSETFGNSVSGIGAAKKFNYGFDGYNVTLLSKYQFGKNAISLGGQYLSNEDAPSDRNMGYLAILGFKRNLYGFYVESFKNESDTSPGFYNSKYYGHNNMQGTGGTFKVESKTFNLNLRYVDMKPIEANAIQAKTQIVSFNLSKSYDF